MGVQVPMAEDISVVNRISKPSSDSFKGCLCSLYTNALGKSMRLLLPVLCPVSPDSLTKCLVTGMLQWLTKSQCASYSLVFTFLNQAPAKAVTPIVNLINLV